ncbi:MAG: hypothetical protein IKE30_02380 [Clostridia bacterium]|nr:hypothetical protein [Clostridia bacterium]
MLEPYRKTMLLRSCDADFNGRWRPGAVFTAMQEAGEDHASRLGFGFSDLRAQNLCWVLSRASLEMARYPELGEEIQIVTWPEKARHTVFPRMYMFFDANGNLYGRAASLWVLMDIETRQMVHPAARGLSMPEVAGLEGALPIPGGLCKMDGAEETRITRYPVYTDLDVNGHVNNAKYIDWLSNALPVRRHREGWFRSILIHYMAETLPDEAVELTLSQKESTVALSGAQKGQMHFALRAVWQDNGKAPQ